MTAIVALEQSNLDHFVTVPKDALVFTSKSRFAAGKKLQTFELIYPLLTESSNEAALTLSSYFGHERFKKLMNAKAVSIGMINTSFKDAAGIGSENKSTPEYLVLLARYILNYRKQILDISASKFGGNSFYGEPSIKNLDNFNLFYKDSDFIEGKTGQTKAAGETMLAVYKIKFGEIERPIAAIILRSEDNEADIKNLIENTKNSFVIKDIKR